MKPLAAQHSSLPLVSGKEELELQSCLQGMAHMPTAQSHRAEGKAESSSLSLWLCQPSGVRILPRGTWEPIQHIPVFLTTIVNILEARGPASSDAAQITESWCHCVSLTLHTYNSCLGTDRRGARDNWKTFLLMLKQLTNGKLLKTRWGSWLLF